MLSGLHACVTWCWSHCCADTTSLRDALRPRHAPSSCVVVLRPRHAPSSCVVAKTCTIILRGAEQFIAESERSIHDTIMIVRRAMKNDSVFAGGGAIEVCG